jgi:diguanylate cyclase (GGDEF)-like protein/hemerythrin-like metal-binding protein
LLGLTLIWWLVRVQLAPMTAALQTLDGFVRQNQPPQALPVVRQDEVGQLVGGFNRLLDTLLQQQKVLQSSETLKQAVLNSVTAEIAVLDHDGLILATNDAWRSFAQDDLATPGPHLPGAGAAVGANYLAICQAAAVEKDASDDATPIHRGIQAVLDGHLPRFYLEYQSRPLPHPRWLSMSVTPLESQALRGAVVSLEDITERMLMAQHVHQLAFYDPLTQLPNRRLALERLTQQLVRAKRTQSRLALLFIDLDKFKPINDELGHEVGDWLLQAVAQRILSCVRASDTAARMGGDEFVVLLPDLQASDDALAVAEKIRSVLAQEFVTSQGVALSISSSIGVALYPDHGDNDKDLLRRGDEAMYRAKNGGRNAVTMCSPVRPRDVSGRASTTRESYVHLRWKVAFECGHPEIDEEHRMLFQLANKLLDQVPLSGQQPLAFETAYHKLLDHVTAHFAHEEAILLAHGYAQLTAHAQQHQALIRRANALFQATRAQDARDADEGELVKFLVNELVAAHLLHADRAFFEVVARSV